MEFILLGFLLALGKFLLMVKFLPMKKVLYFDKWIDLFFTIVLPIVLMGTFSGAILAVMSGLWLSLMLLIAKRVIGCEAPNWFGRPKARFTYSRR